MPFSLQPRLPQPHRQGYVDYFSHSDKYEQYSFSKPRFPLLLFERCLLYPKSSDNYCKYRLRLSLRAPEGCVAISSEKARLLRFTRNDNSYSWIWEHDTWLTPS